MLKLTKLFSIILLIYFMTGCSSFKNEEKPQNGSFKTSYMDTTVTPGNDFYTYAVGNWVKENPIPDEYSIWTSFTVLAENNYIVLHKILNKAAEDKNAEEGSIEQKVGDFYYTGMDSAKINKDGFAPLKPELEKIDNIKSKKDFYNQLVFLHRQIANPLFSFGSGPDAKNSEMVISQLDQSGLGLPDRDYYLNNDDRSKDIRKNYVEHIAKMFQLIGENEPAAKQDAEQVMAIETRLAKASMSRVERRDPNKTYNKMSYSALKKLTPDFDWNYYFTSVGLKDPGDINVASPGFFKEVDAMVKSTPAADWKAYLKWNLIRGTANYLSDDFVNEHFNFFGKYLNGLKVLQPRWKRVLGSTNRNLGKALGQLYVQEVFPPEAKQRAKKIVMTLLDALKERINNLDWMSSETKEKAMAKLAAFTVKIGYPDKWEDFTNLHLKRDSYLDNMLRCSLFEYKRDLDKIGKPVDKTEWFMNPQTVNAYYNPLNNEIVFPAAILQPPFYDPKADDAINYGAMGAVIGHEITHGFDDEGRQYDAQGNIKDWWTKADGERFKERAQKIIDQFNSYAAIDTFHINGELTEGENIADLGGLNVSFTAFKNTKQYKNNEIIDGLTPAQRFFISWANIWKNNIRPQALKLRLKTDPHSPGKFRVLGPLTNMPEFWKAFNVKKGEPMRMPDDKLVKIW